MRSNLEDNLAKNVRHSGAKFATSRYVLTGAYTIRSDGPQFHFLDCGGVDRTVFMPPLIPGGGHFYIITNLGLSGSLNVVDSLGVAIQPIAPGTTGLAISSPREWKMAITSPVGSNAPVGASFITGVSEPGLLNELVLTNTSTITWDLTTPGQARANAVLSGVLITGSPFPGQIARWVDANHIEGVNGNSLFQPLDGDLTALAATAGTDVIYYRAGVDAWSAVSIGAGLTFSGGVLAATSPSTGNVSNSGIPLSGQFARWTDATHIQGIDISSLGFATLASPIFSGDPQAPTPAPGDSDTSIATTAFVQAAVVAGSPFTTGDVKLTFKTNPDPGWIIANDGSIGNTASGATTRNNPDTAALFTLMWNNIPSLVVQNSGGATVARGGSAAADFAANRRLVLPATLGRALASAGAGSGLTSRLLGVPIGAEGVSQTAAQMAPHAHNTTMIAGTGFGSIVNWLAGDNSGGNIPVQTDVQGGGAPMNIMQPTTFLWVMIKL